MKRRTFETLILHCTSYDRLRFTRLRSQSCRLTSFIILGPSNSCGITFSIGGVGPSVRRLSEGKSVPALRGHLRGRGHLNYPLCAIGVLGVPSTSVSECRVYKIVSRSKRILPSTVSEVGELVRSWCGRWGRKACFGEESVRFTYGCGRAYNDVRRKNVFYRMYRYFLRSKCGKL